MISAFLHNPRAEPFFSFLIGLGFSVMLFHRPVHSQRSLALDVSEIEKNVAKVDGKCFKYRVEDSTCKLSSPK
jgi:hypothetical protein